MFDELQALGSQPGVHGPSSGPWRGSRAGMGNSFGSACHIRDKLGILRPVYFPSGLNKYSCNLISRLFFMTNKNFSPF
jgi:hypothetical protein